MYHVEWNDGQPTVTDTETGQPANLIGRLAGIYAEKHDILPLNHMLWSTLVYVSTKTGGALGIGDVETLAALVQFVATLFATAEDARTQEVADALRQIYTKAPVVLGAA